MITERSTVVAAEGLAFADLDGESIVLNTATGVYYGLNEIGTQLLQMASRPVRVSEIVAELAAQYEVEHEVLQEDMLEFLGRLLDSSLIQEVRDERVA